MKNFRKIIITLFLIFFSSNALANQILINPSRIVFEGKDRSGRVIISNPSDETARYKVTLVDKRMTIDGKIENVETLQENEKSANNLIRFSPKRFTLAPNQSRTIRIKVKNSNELPDGEYRSHLRVELLPESKLPENNTENVQIQIKVNYGVAIPLIVRKGDLNYSVAVDDLKLNQTNCKSPKLNIKLSREGTKSSHGDITIFHIDKDNNSKLIKHLKGIAMFYPNNKRKIKINLNNNDQCFEKGSQLKFIYSNHSKSKNSGNDLKGHEIIAQKLLTI